jgi:glyoxylase-like metal-dependent hydrolase (beta-lactamase superfamily II)
MRQSRTRFQRTQHLCYRYTDPSLFSSDALPHRDDSIQPARPPKEFRVLLLKS